jgi:His-Xaa-Ser system protein HxsD
MGPLTVTFSREAATVDAIQRAAYRLADRFSLDLRGDAETLTCHLQPAAGVDADEAQLEHVFRTEVLDQVLRARISEETRDERNLILAFAFSKSGLVDSA